MISGHDRVHRAHPSSRDNYSHVFTKDDTLGKATSTFIQIYAGAFSPAALGCKFLEDAKYSRPLAIRLRVQLPRGCQIQRTLAMLWQQLPFAQSLSSKQKLQ